jgi:hypothetical protein
LNAYIDLYADAVEKKKIRFDNVADLDRAVRLLSHVRGEASSISVTHATVSLEVMQRRHAEARAMVAARVDDLSAGVLGGPTDDEIATGESG